MTRFCPKCGQELWHQVGEDEFGGDVLIPYDRLCCTNAACDFGWIDTEDYDDVPEEPVADLSTNVLKNVIALAIAGALGGVLAHLTR